MPAGPSEVLVIADESARPEFVAADLLAQAEHSEDAQVVLVTDLARTRRGLHRRGRAPDGQSAAARHHRALDGREPRAARAGPRHRARGQQPLRSRTPDPPGRRAARLARSACETPARCSSARGPPRPWATTAAAPTTCCPPTAMPAPTAGSAVADFVKRMTVQEVTPAGLADLGRTARTLARLESLDAHAPRGHRATRGHRTGVAGVNPILALARPDILELQPYQHAAWDPSLERMHANEMPWRAEGDDSAAGLNRYPEPQPHALVERMATLYDVPTRQRARGPRQRRGHRPAGARLLPGRRGQRGDHAADLRLLQGCGAHPGCRASSRCRC